MFYDDFCKTYNQKIVFQALLKLSKNGGYIAIQELNYLNLPQKELEEILFYFEEKGLFKEVVHLEKNQIAFFRL